MSEWIVEIGDGNPHIKSMKELVRCKDCRHWLDVIDVEDGIQYGECELFSDRHVFGENWFCKDGERREVTE